jgi:hypothetical protein
MTDLSGDYTRVRLADERDEEELFTLCELLQRENACFPMDEDKVRDTLRKGISGPLSERMAMVGVIGKPGAIEGSIYLELGQLWYSSSWCIMELWNYVLPQKRSSSNSRDLIAFAIHVSDKFKAPLMIGVLSNERTEAKVRLYRKQLGAPSGAFFLHGVTTGQGVNN